VPFSDHNECQWSLVHATMAESAAVTIVRPRIMAEIVREDYSLWAPLGKAKNQVHQSHVVTNWRHGIVVITLVLKSPCSNQGIDSLTFLPKLRVSYLLPSTQPNRSDPVCHVRPTYCAPHRHPSKMSSAAERAEARRKAILARGNDRLAKLTTSARGEDAAGVFQGGTRMNSLT